MNSTRLLANALAVGLPLERARAVSGVGSNPMVDVVLDVARTTGIRRSTALDLVADAEDQSARLVRMVEVGSSSARQTANILSGLPVLTVCAAELFGFPVLRVLFGSSFGWICLGAGALGVVMGWAWMARIRGAIPHITVGLGLALTIAAEIARSNSLGRDQRGLVDSLAVGWGTLAELASLDSLQSTAREFGVPLANILELEAQRVRREAMMNIEMAIELLPGRLLGPVGACLLPAFVLTTVVPIVVSMATNFGS